MPAAEGARARALCCVGAPCAAVLLVLLHPVALDVCLRALPALRANVWLQLRCAFVICRGVQ